MKKYRYIKVIKLARRIPNFQQRLNKAIAEVERVENARELERGAYYLGIKIV